MAKDNDGAMPQYAVTIFDRVPAEELPPEVMQAHGALPDRVAEGQPRLTRRRWRSAATRSSRSFWPSA